MIKTPNNIFHPSIQASFYRLKPFLDNKKKNTYLTAILSLLSLSFFGVFAIKPTLTTAVSLNRDIQDLKVLNAQYEEKITSIIKAQSAYEQIRDDIPLFYATLPKTPLSTKVLIEEEKIATSSNVIIEQIQIDSIPISKLENQTTLQEFNLTMVVTGDYIDTYNFINHLLKSQRIVSIDELNLEQQGSTTGGKLNVSLKGKSFYEP